MNTGPRHEPLDQDEAALARRLRSLPGGQPPAELDARILARAHAALVPQRPPLRPWVWGVSTAAVAVLAVGMIWQAGLPPGSEEVQYRAPPAPVPQSVEALVEDTATPATSEPPAEGEDELRAEMHFEEPPPPPPATQRQRERSATDAAAVRRAPMAAPLPGVAPTVAPASAPSEPAPAAAVQDPPDLRNDGPATRDQAARQEAASVPAQEADRREETAGSAAPSAPRRSERPIGAAAQRKALDADRADTLAADLRAFATAPPAEWLEHILSLQRDGRMDEARSHLRAFRQRHPGHALPDSLEPLLPTGD